MTVEFHRYCQAGCGAGEREILGFCPACWTRLSSGARAELLSAVRALVHGSTHAWNRARSQALAELR